MNLSAACLLGAVVVLTATAASAGPPAGPQLTESVKKQAVELLTQLIAMNITHANGSTQAAEFLAAQARAAGIAPEDVTTLAPPGHPDRGNVVVRLHGRSGDKPVLFLGHLDVVEARKEDWSVDPFLLTSKNGYFYGRGTLDMKGDDIALFSGLMRMKNDGYVPERDVVVALTADEEAGARDTNGVDWLLREHRNLIDANLAFNPDSGGGASSGDRRLYVGLETSEKVFVTFGLEVTNKGGHSSLPEPDNAIYRLAAGLDRISRVKFPVRTSTTTRAWFGAMAGMETGQLRRDMSAMTQEALDPTAIARLEKSVFYNAMLHTTCVATIISGGHAENALPQRANATIQCRMLPDDTQEGVRAILIKALADSEIKVSMITPAAPGPESVATPAIMRTVESVVGFTWTNLSVIPDMDAGASDSKYTRGAGIPTFGITGLFTDIDDNRAHGRDEQIPTEGYYEDLEFTYRLMSFARSAREPGGDHSLDNGRKFQLA